MMITHYNELPNAIRLLQYLMSSQTVGRLVYNIKNGQYQLYSQVLFREIGSHRPGQPTQDQVCSISQTSHCSIAKIKSIQGIPMAQRIGSQNVEIGVYKLMIIFIILSFNAQINVIVIIFNCQWLMEKKETPVRPIPQTNDFSFISYAGNQIQGECILKTIQGLRENQTKFVLYVILSILTVGVPLLISFWYIHIKRWFYFDFCDVQEATHFYVLNYDNQYTIVEKKSGKIHYNDISHEQCYYFINRFLKYYYNKATTTFSPITYDSIPRINQLVNEKDRIRGYENDTVESLRQCYGKCAMEMPTPSCLVLFVRQILQPFFIFILYSVILWFYEAYYYYASIIVFTSAVSITINLFQIMELNKKIFEMAFYQTHMHILRSNKVIETTSIDIVPGDIVFIKKSVKLPFDGILLGGSVLMNQCALTGQSVPIVKKGIDKQEFNEKKIVDKSCLLFEGTELVQVCSHSRNPVHQQFQEFGLMVCVTRTNFTTTKGQLIRIISFPRGRDIKFYVESAKFVGFLFVLAVISYGILVSKLQGNVAPKDIATKFFDLITITVPPGLPASMSIGIGYSLHKLEQNKIYCISPDKVILGGRIQHICFDKTGTLTEDFMDFYEFIPKQKDQFLKPMNLATRDKPQNHTILIKNKDAILSLNNMATCHSIMNLEGTDKMIGDPMEIKLFEFGRFSLSKSDSKVSKNYHESLFSFKGATNEGTVFRRFQFNSQIHRMSAIASTSEQPDVAYIYCKGAPETMLKIMKPEGIPKDYNSTLEKYTSCGFRVLAVASKSIPLDKISNIDRQTAENSLNFNGFEVFENKLKPETYGAIETLKQAGITIVIITGDNVLTGANIGFKSGVIQKDKNIMICDLLPNKRVKVTNFYEQDNKQAQQQNEVNVTIMALDQADAKTKVKTEKDFECSIQELPSIASQIANRTNLNYVFCVTGSVFSSVFDDNLTEEKKQFIKHIRVFARSKPNDKTRAVAVYQSLGKITAMCGDGANDCGALKQSDAGLSLSQAEASISSPFTSKTPNIGSMINLIRECRAGLATNFSLFNIMALYSLIQYSTTLIGQYYYEYPADLEYLYEDLGHNFFFFLTIGYTASVDKLSKLRPNDSLFSVSNISCVFIMFVTQFVGQIGVIILMSNNPFSSIINYYQLAGQQNNLIAYQNNSGFLNSNAEIQALFMFSNFMYTFSVMAFSISAPWKKFFATNLPFMAILIFVMIYDILICLYPAARLVVFKMDQTLLPFDMRFQGLILGYAFAVGIFMYVNQKFILEPLFNHLRQKYPDKHWL